MGVIHTQKHGPLSTFGRTRRSRPDGDPKMLIVAPAGRRASCRAVRTPPPPPSLPHLRPNDEPLRRIPHLPHLPAPPCHTASDHAATLRCPPAAPRATCAESVTGIWRPHRRLAPNPAPTSPPPSRRRLLRTRRHPPLLRRGRRGRRGRGHGASRTERGLPVGSAGSRMGRPKTSL